MARFYRRRRHFSRNYRRRMSPYRSWRGAVYRSQNSGTRRFSIAIPVSGQVNIPVVNGTNVTQTFAFFPFASYTDQSPVIKVNSCMGNLYLNNIFYTYCNLYDEVKLNSFSVRLSVLSVPVDGKGCFVESCLDRHANVTDVEDIRSHANVQNSAEVQNNQFTSLERANVYRFYRARDLGERINFLDSTYVDVVDEQHQPAQWGRRQVEDWGYGGGGAFAPKLTFYIRLLSPPANGSSVLVSYNVVWYLTFRNPKASIGAASRGLSMTDLKNDVLKDVGDGLCGGSEIDEETIKKLKELMHEDVQLPLTEEDTRASMDDGEKDEKAS